MSIIHISTDYPDSYQSAKTHAIFNLVKAASLNFDQQVYSLNRRPLSSLSGLARWFGNDWGKDILNYNDTALISSWTYRAPSNGLFLKSSLDAVADAIAEDIVKQGLVPSLIQGHKLSMEGLIAWRVARNFDVPFAISIQGNTDRKVLQVRRDLWPIYRTIYHEAAVVFPFAPWAWSYCENVLGARQGKTVMLPCITPQDQIITPKIVNNQIMSAFHLRHWKIKNFDAMAKSSYLAHKRGHISGLSLYGGGDVSLVNTIKDRATKYGKGSVKICGPASAENIQSIMNQYAAFTMISRKESFGMVFVEALLAGCPIIYPIENAVDGYFNNLSFAQAVPSHDIQAVAEMMDWMVINQERNKADLAIWQESPEGQKFRSNNIGEKYRKALGSILINKVSDIA